jgi:hypothetical protein
MAWGRRKSSAKLIKKNHPLSYFLVDSSLSLSLLSPRHLSYKLSHHQLHHKLLARPAAGHLTSGLPTTSLSLFTVSYFFFLHPSNINFTSVSRWCLHLNLYHQSTVRAIDHSFHVSNPLLSSSLFSSSPCR